MRFKKPKTNENIEAKPKAKSKMAMKFAGMLGKFQFPAKRSLTRKSEKTKTPNKFRKGERFALFVGDDGAILVYMRENVVLVRQFVSDASEQNLDELRRNLEVDSQAPMSVVVDNLDQTYVHQSLPPVSSMSVRKLMKRRLDRDFGAEDIKGSVLLGREESGRKDWNFLMISIEKNPQLSAWLQFVYALPNRFGGIYLASLETEVILTRLEQAIDISEGEVSTSKWKFFVSHNKVGGFRQVILRDGRIVFTRMAQPIGESTPEVIAGNIEQEMQSTIEYMKRLSFDPKSGLDIYVIAGSNVRSMIDKAKFAYGRFCVMNPFEMAQHLGIDGATQPTDQFGDVVLAAVIASSPKRALEFTTPESKKFKALYALFYAQRVIAAAIMLGVMSFAMSQLSDIYTLYVAAGEIADKHSGYQKQLDNLKAEIKKDKRDMINMVDTVSLYAAMRQPKPSPLVFISKIESVIKSPVVVKSIDWSIDEKTLNSEKMKTLATLTLEFPQVRTPEEWRVVSKQFLTDLKANLKGYDATFTKLPNKFSEAEKVDITFGASKEKQGSPDTDQEVQLTIKEL